MSDDSGAATASSAQVPSANEAFAAFGPGDATTVSLSQTNAAVGGGQAFSAIGTATGFAPLSAVGAGLQAFGRFSDVNIGDVGGGFTGSTTVGSDTGDNQLGTFPVRQQQQQDRRRAQAGAAQPAPDTPQVSPAATQSARRGTILTGTLGLSTPAPVQRKTLLGS